MDAERTLDHRGISVTAGEGLVGGGTIEKSVALALSIESLQIDEAHTGKEWLIFYDKESNQQFRMQLEGLAKVVIRMVGYDTKVLELEQKIDRLEREVRMLSIWERLERLESLIHE